MVYHELDLMQAGPTEAPEYRTDGACRIALPLGVERVRLKGFSPYSEGNAASEVPALRFRWASELVIEFGVPSN